MRSIMVSEAQAVETVERPSRAEPYTSELSPRHRAMIYMAVQGHSNGEIAETLGVHPSTVGMVLRSPLAKSEIARLQKQIEEKIVSQLTLREELDEDLKRVARKSVVLAERIVDGSYQGDVKALRTRASTARHVMDRVIFEKLEDEKDGSYRQLLRRLDEIEGRPPVLIQNNVGIGIAGVTGQGPAVPGGGSDGTHPPNALLPASAETDQLSGPSAAEARVGGVTDPDLAFVRRLAGGD